MARKIIQITATTIVSGNSHSTTSVPALFALADDGTIWQYRPSWGGPVPTHKQWEQVPALPQSPE